MCKGMFKSRHYKLVKGHHYHKLPLVLGHQQYLFIHVLQMVFTPHVTLRSTILNIESMVTQLDRKTILQV